METIIKADRKLTVVMCCQIVAKRHTAPSSGHFCSVDWALDSYRSSLLLTHPTCLCIFKQKTTKKIKVFFSIFYHNFFLTIFTPHFFKKNTFEIFKPNLQKLTECWQPCHQNNKERLKKKLTIETLSQKLGSMAGLGLRICQRMLTNCCFCTF